MFVIRLAVIIALASPAIARAQLRLPNLLSDHAVLQRGQPIHIWGWAHADEKIVVHFHTQTADALANSIGEWETWLRPESAGGPYTLTVDGGDSSASAIERKDILVGDVWFASGQSNMEFPLNGFADAPLKDGEKEIAAATYPRIRLLVQKKMTSPIPVKEASSSWTECTPGTARSFSAVAYFFGREISKRENVPVGLIDSTWGGTPAHSWISPDGMGAANLMSVFEEAGRIARDQAHADDIRAYYSQEDAALKLAGKPVPTRPRIQSDHGGAWTPGTLFNAMIAPYIHYTIKGVIWYQGESDSDSYRAPHYFRVFSTLISDWRHQWGEGDFPFLFTQISSYAPASEGWSQVRDAQRRALTLRNTGMAVTLDVGLANNVHPPNKQSVASRLALIARGLVYGEKIEYSSPEFLQATTEANAMRVWLTHADDLSTHGQPVNGFEVAGDDHKFKPATAVIERIGENETVVVTSTQVQFPRFVRYGWSGAVTSFLYNEANLPLGTFSSE